MASLYIKLLFVIVDGAWTDWGSWGACTASCGHGTTRNRNRTCDDPPPQYGGNDCPPSDPVTDTEACAFVHCPIRKYIMHLIVVVDVSGHDLVI